MRSPELLGRSSSRLVIVDMQEKLLPLIAGNEPVIENCVRLLKAAGILQIPVSATEQYPKGLGATVPVIRSLLPEEVPEKLRFSSAEALDWVQADRTPEDRLQVVVAGIEAHVCMMQTVFDLLAAGFDVFVPADATSSRNDSDRDIALQRMRDGGAHIVTTEMVLFEWAEVAGTDEFKQISRLVTGR